MLDFYERTKDPGKACKMLPNGCRVQKLMFKALQRNGVEAYEAALRAVPHNARAIYVQSFQVWPLSHSRHAALASVQGMDWGYVQSAVNLDFCMFACWSMNNS